MALLKEISTTGLVVKSIGWKGNMEAISAALKGTKMDASENLVRNDDGYWSINGVKAVQL